MHVRRAPAGMCSRQVAPQRRKAVSFAHLPHKRLWMPISADPMVVFAEQQVLVVVPVFCGQQRVLFGPGSRHICIMPHKDLQGCNLRTRARTPPVCPLQATVRSRGVYAGGQRVIKVLGSVSNVTRAFWGVMTIGLATRGSSDKLAAPSAALLQAAGRASCPVSATAPGRTWLPSRSRPAATVPTHLVVTTLSHHHAACPLQPVMRGRHADQPGCAKLGTRAARAAAAS